MPFACLKFTVLKLTQRAPFGASYGWVDDETPGIVRGCAKYESSKTISLTFLIFVPTFLDISSRTSEISRGSPYPFTLRFISLSR
jgi:hypothetical protein